MFIFPWILHFPSQINIKNFSALIAAALLIWHSSDSSAQRSKHRDNGHIITLKENYEESVRNMERCVVWRMNCCDNKHVWDLIENIFNKSIKSGSSGIASCGRDRLTEILWSQLESIFIKQNWVLTKLLGNKLPQHSWTTPTDVMHFYIIIKNSWNAGTRSGASRIPSNKKELNSRGTLLGGMFKIIGKLLVFWKQRQKHFTTF